MKIVTGYKGEAHITSNDDQGRNQGIFGTQNYILNVGNKLAVEANGTSTVKIKDGEGVIQGVHFRVEPGTNTNVTLTLPSSGNHREDYLVVRYTKNSVSGVEAVTAEILQGTAVPTSMDTVPPTPTDGDILGGDTTADMVLAKIISENSGIVSITATKGNKPYWVYSPSVPDIEEQLDTLGFAVSGNSAQILQLQGAVADVKTTDENTISLSGFTQTPSATLTCKAYKNHAGMCFLMLNVQGFVAGTTEVTIGTLPSDIVPLTNFFKICQSSFGDKYTLVVRTNRNIGIIPIDEVDASVIGNYQMWYRESVTFAIS